MFVDISQLKDRVNAAIGLCDDADSQVRVLADEARDRVKLIDQSLSEAGIGLRVSARTLENMEPSDLRSLVSTLLTQLYSCRELLDDMCLTNAQGALSEIPNDILRPLILQSDYSQTISERLTNIDSFVDNVKPVLSHIESYQKSCTDLQHQISKLSDIKASLAESKPLPPSHSPIIDWSNFNFPALPTVTEHTSIIRQELESVHDAQLRRNNVIIRGLTVSTDQPNDPLFHAKSFLEHCGIENFKLFQKDLTNAFFLNKRDGLCTIRMIFNNQWTAEYILESAHKLKSAPELYQRVYLTKDRTIEEMKQHRVLVTELKKRIKDFPTTRWVIFNDKIVDKGPFRL